MDMGRERMPALAPHDLDIGIFMKTYMVRKPAHVPASANSYQGYRFFFL
jgi:hypothetical protein